MEHSPPRVIPVRPPTPTKDPHPDLHPHLPQISGHGGGACLLMISPVKTGKSTIISNLLLNKDFYDAGQFYVAKTNKWHNKKSLFSKNSTEAYNLIFGSNQKLLSHNYDKYCPLLSMKMFP